MNIGFSTNGEGENKILAPRAIILDQAAKPRGQEKVPKGQEFYSRPRHWLRILFLRISNSLEAAYTGC